MRTLFTLFFLILLINYYFVSSGQSTFSGEHLTGTQLLSQEEVEQIRPKMLKGISDHFESSLKSSVENRESFWQRDYSSFKNYTESVLPNRNRFKKIIGLVDRREVIQELFLNESSKQSSLVAGTDKYTIYSVSWPVLEGVTGTGLWIEPSGHPVAQIVVLPDADQTPEMLTGLHPGAGSQGQFARLLAERGCRILIPVLINRDDKWSGNPGIRMTNQPHREFIYRRAYETGRHIIGYEVQKVLSAVDWFKNKSEDLPVAVAGYGEGGLVALYSAAADTRIDGVLVSGYFQEREEVWKEPLYRNVWGLLTEFGDAEIAGLIAPRLLIIEACKGTEINGPPEAKGDHRGVAAPGRLTTPVPESVKREAGRAKKIYARLGVPGKIQVIESNNDKGLPGSAEVTGELLKGLGIEKTDLIIQDNEITDRRAGFDPELRMRYQFNELLNHLDKVIIQSNKERERFWERADYSSPEKWEETTEYYREYFRNELMGRMPDPSEPFNPRSRLTYETDNWKGYWIQLDVWPGIIAAGILLVPKNIDPGEKKPVVVFQHGLGGRPEPLTDPEIKSAYYSFGSELADSGYIVYAPQNPYGLLIEEPSDGKSFRIVQRMANPLKQSLFSVITGQHDQTLKWLKQLPFVDGERIGFYGLSYGGKTAMRVPPVLHKYSVVICSGDFNEWVWKTTSLDFVSSYMFVGEYEIFEFDLANTYNYSEMAGLIAPRPFMVERGHWDGVAPDEWVAYEYAKVRRLYDRMGVGANTTIEFFNGPHEIHGVGTMDFLNKHLKCK